MLLHVFVIFTKDVRRFGIFYMHNLNLHVSKYGT